MRTHELRGHPGWTDSFPGVASATSEERAPLHHRDREHRERRRCNNRDDGFDKRLSKYITRIFLHPDRNIILDTVGNAHVSELAEHLKAKMHQ